MRVLVCGSREWKDAFIVNAVLGGIHAEVCSWNGNMTVIEGDARGADRIAGKWANATNEGAWNVAHETYPADWDTFGKQAGYLRNVEMLKEGKPDVVVAFGHGKGTDMMVELAMKAGVPVYRVTHEVGWTCVRGGTMTRELADNRTVLGALYQAANQALDTLRWLTSLDARTNLKSDTLLLERAIRMADEAASRDSASADTRPQASTDYEVAYATALREIAHIRLNDRATAIARRAIGYAPDEWPGPLPADNPSGDA